MSTTTSEGTASHTIRLATAADKENVISALTAGFANDIIIQKSLFSDPDTYSFYAGGYFACYTDFVLEHGYAWTTGDDAGALIGMTSQAWQRAQQDARLKERMMKATGPYFEKLSVLDAALAKRHPISPDHLYLALIGVRPEQRGRNIATRLERAGIELADQMGLPIYGEATGERNSRFHSHAGLPLHGEPFRLPGVDTNIYPLWRQPSPPAI